MESPDLVTMPGRLGVVVNAALLMIISGPSLRGFTSKVGVLMVVPEFTKNSGRVACGLVEKGSSG
jgi:hypothetical protein